MFPRALVSQAESLIAGLRQRGDVVVTAESCTGGLVAAILTDVPGASDVFDRGFVTYSNFAKMACLGVPAHVLDRFGAVSPDVAEAMALGALNAAALATISVAITGIAGPGGGSAEKPVGLVYVGVAQRGGTTEVRRLDLGDIGREAVRLASVSEALAMVASRVSEEDVPQ